MKPILKSALLCALFAIPLVAQYPIPWAVTPGVVGSPPATRENPAAASLTHMYKFGGASGNSSSVTTNALWSFDGTTWVQETAEGAAGSPLPRTQAAVCWDYGRNKLMVFGGLSTSAQAPSPVLGDLWEWDPVTGAWTQLMVATPPARRFCSMAWDPSGSGFDLILFGGLSATGVHLDDTWGYASGAGWVQLNPATVPPERRQHHLITRPEYADILMCAGQNATQSAPAKWRFDTWTWNGSDWTQVSTPNTPISVVANAAVYDPIRQRVVMLGGNGTAGGSPTSQMSEFDCLTNDWTVYGYATPGTADPVIGRISRYFAAYLPTTGKIHKIGGQNPSGRGASTTITCEYGLGLPDLYLGNGADLQVELFLNGASSAGNRGVHVIAPTDTFSLSFTSPGGSLVGQPVGVATTFFVTGSPPAGLATSGTAPDLWVDFPNNIIWFFDGLTMPGPTLPGAGLALGPLPTPPSFANSSLSIMVQMATTAPGFNPISLGLSDALELRFD